MCRNVVGGASPRQPEPTALVPHQSDCFNIGDIESRLPLRARGVTNLRPLVVLLGESLGRRSASKTTDRRDRDGNDLLSWQASRSECAAIRMLGHDVDGEPTRIGDSLRTVSEGDAHGAAGTF